MPYAVPQILKKDFQPSLLPKILPFVLKKRTEHKNCKTAYNQHNQRILEQTPKHVPKRQFGVFAVKLRESLNFKRIFPQVLILIIRLYSNAFMTGKESLQKSDNKPKT